MICYHVVNQRGGSIKMELKKERFTTYIPKLYKKKIIELSEETRIPQARLFEEAAYDLLMKYGVDITTEEMEEEKNKKN